MSREKIIERHALSSCFFACRCPETAARFRATWIKTPLTRPPRSGGRVRGGRLKLVPIPQAKQLFAEVRQLCCLVARLFPFTRIAGECSPFRGLPVPPTVDPALALLGVLLLGRLHGDVLRHTHPAFGAVGTD